MHVRQELFDLFFMQRLPRAGFTLEGESKGEVSTSKRWLVGPLPVPESPVNGFSIPDPFSQGVPQRLGGSSKNDLLPLDPAVR